MSQCQFIKPNKTQCQAKPITGDTFCFWHSSQTKKKRDLAIRDGGLSLKRNYGGSDQIAIKTTSDVLLLIEQTINDLRNNKTNCKTANALGYLAGIALKTIEQDSISKRLEVIEYVLDLKQKTT